MSTPATEAPPLEWGAWFTLALVILGGILLVRDIAPADMVFLGVNAMLMISGVITVKEGTAGFSGSGVLTVGILMVASAGLTQTGALGYFMGKLLGTPKTVTQALVRLLIPCAICGFFINDTPVFLMFVPIFQSWAPKLGDMVDPRQFYVPMSLTCLLAGTMTLIGTSTNLVVAGKAAEVYPELVFDMFGITPFGTPVLFYGLAYIIFFADKVLPHKKKEEAHGLMNEAAGSKRKKGATKSEGFSLASMTLSCTVDPNSPAIGKSINEAGLRNLLDIYLVAITRGDLVIHAVDPEVRIHGKDVISFSGNPDHFVAICKEKGFTPITDQGEEFPEANVELGNVNKLLDGHVVSVMVRDGSNLLGKAPRDVGFRAKYDASIISIQRAGADIRDKPIGQISLAVGDILVLLTGPDFESNLFKNGAESQDLKILDGPKTSSPRTQEKLVVEQGQYLVGARIVAKPKLQLTKSLNGMTVGEAGLRNLVGVSLVGITRPNVSSTDTPDETDQSYFPNAREGASTSSVIRAPGPNVRLHAGDICWFTGGRDAVQNVRAAPGLELLGESQASKLKARSEQRRLIEVAIAPTSNLIGSTVREARFRTRFGAAVVAIRRGATDAGHLGNVANVYLKVGDVLMLDAGPDFAERYGKDRNFLIVSEVNKSTPPQFTKFYFALFVFIGMFVTFIATDTKVSLIPLGFIGSGLMVAFRVLTPVQARAAVHWETLTVIAAAYGLSAAMEKTGLARAIGEGMVNMAVATGSGEAGIIAALYISTMLIGFFVANNAAALLMFGIGAAAQQAYGLDPFQMIYTIMLAASASFATPYGYQTNIMSMSLGPYTPVQFIKFGAPLQFILCPLSIWVMVFMDKPWVNIVISSVVLVLVCIWAFMKRPSPWEQAVDDAKKEKDRQKESSGDANEQEMQDKNGPSPNGMSMV